MKQDIENIIRTNLPEKKEDDGFAQDPSVAFNNGFDEAISQIDISLIADEVLKVVKMDLERRIKYQKKVLPSSYETGYTHALEDLLEHLSLNKENTNNE